MALEDVNKHSHSNSEHLNESNSLNELLKKQLRGSLLDDNRRYEYIWIFGYNDIEYWLFVRGF